MVSIGNDVFSKSKIINLTLSSNIKDLAIANSFDSIKSLENVFVAEDNPYYISIDCILYTKNMTTLYIIPRNKSVSYYSVPFGVRKILAGAIQNSYISTLVISETVRDIGGYFGRFSQIQHIVIKQTTGHLNIDKTDYFFDSKFTPIFEYMSAAIPTCVHWEISIFFCYLFNFIVLS